MKLQGVTYYNHVLCYCSDRSTNNFLGGEKMSISKDDLVKILGSGEQTSITTKELCEEICRTKSAQLAYYMLFYHQNRGHTLTNV